VEEVDGVDSKVLLVLVEVEASVVVSSVADGVVAVVVIFVTSGGLVSATVFGSKFEI
jgi:hypothetical protein